MKLRCCYAEVCQLFREDLAPVVKEFLSPSFLLSHFPLEAPYSKCSSLFRLPVRSGQTVSRDAVSCYSNSHPCVQQPLPMFNAKVTYAKFSCFVAVLVCKYLYRNHLKKSVIYVSSFFYFNFIFPFIFPLFPPLFIHLFISYSLHV
jgi:hypothetical protein